MRIPETDFVIQDITSLGNSTEIHRKLFGILFKFHQSGTVHWITVSEITSSVVEFGTFSISAALSLLANGMGLLALVTFLVDILAVYVLERREHYAKAKYEIVQVDPDGTTPKKKDE